MSQAVRCAGLASALLAFACAPEDPAHVLHVDLDGVPHCLGAAAGEAGLVITARHCVIDAEGAAVDPARLSLRHNAWVGRVAEVHLLPAGVGGATDRMDGDVALLRAVGAPWTHGLALGAEPRVGSSVVAFLRGTDRPIHGIETTLVRVDALHVRTPGVTCVGDSGGPLILETDQLVGIASLRTGPSCTGGFSMFTRVDVRADWVRSIGTRTGSEVDAD